MKFRLWDVHPAVIPDLYNVSANYRLEIKAGL